MKVGDADEQKSTVYLGATLLTPRRIELTQPCHWQQANNFHSGKKAKSHMQQQKAIHGAQNCWSIKTSACGKVRSMQETQKYQSYLHMATTTSFSLGASQESVSPSRESLLVYLHPL